MKKRLAALALLFAAACTQPPVSDEVTIEFSDESESVLVTAETRFDLKPGSEEARKRIETARALAQTGGDPWSLRLSRLTPEVERLTYQRTGGVLDRVTRSVRVPSDDLQTIFSDTSVTVDVLEGDGWRELRFYPGSSSRATREQQRRFTSELTTWSAEVARYFAAIHRLYGFMHDNPGRAQYLYAALLSEGPMPVVAEDEQAFVDDVVDAMDAIAARMDAQEGRASTFAEEADLVFNPFPARIQVQMPGDVLALEGFADAKNRSVVIEPVNLLASIAALEGKWISPDPFAAILRDQALTAEQLAQIPRRSQAFVPASEISDAIREQLARPRSYTVRWRN